MYRASTARCKLGIKTASWPTTYSASLPSTYLSFRRQRSGFCSDHPGSRPHDCPLLRHSASDRWLPTRQMAESRFLIHRAVQRAGRSDGHQEVITTPRIVAGPLCRLESSDRSGQATVWDLRSLSKHSAGFNASPAEREDWKLPREGAANR